MDKKTIIISIIIVVLLLIVLVTGYFYWSYLKKKTPDYTAEDITNSALKGVLPSIETNPLENKPDINPADKSNPFKDIKTNPFD